MPHLSLSLSIILMGKITELFRVVVRGRSADIYKALEVCTVLQFSAVITAALKWPEVSRSPAERVSCRSHSGQQEGSLEGSRREGQRPGLLSPDTSTTPRTLSCTALRVGLVGTSPQPQCCVHKAVTSQNLEETAAASQHCQNIKPRA